MERLPQSDHESFLTYWHTLAKAAGGVPVRNAIDPRSLSKMLPNYYLFERRNHEEVIVRLLGTALDAFLPTMSQGSNFLDVYPEEVKPYYASMIRDICEHPCGAFVHRSIALLSGGQVSMGSVALPLKDEGGAVSFIAGIADAPNPGQLLGVAEQKQRLASTVEKLEYIDLGFGVPNETPTLPPPSELSLFPEPEAL